MSGGMMDEQLKSLVSEFSAAIADMVVAMQEKKAGTDEISASLADIGAALDSLAKGASTEKLIEAVKGIRLQLPDVHINVSPTPIQNIVQPATVQILERVQPGDYKLSVTYDNHDRIVEALISRVQI